MLSATPAVASPFQNCAQARAAGVVNIPVGSPAYSLDLDGNGDGLACEDGNLAYNPNLIPAVGTPAPAPVPAPAPGVVTQTPQVAQMPVGGAATGVAQDTTDNTGALALGAGFVLAAVAGGTFAVRRRGAQA